MKKVIPIAIAALCSSAVIADEGKASTKGIKSSNDLSNHIVEVTIENDQVGVLTFPILEKQCGTTTNKFADLGAPNLFIECPAVKANHCESYPICDNQ